MCLPLNLIEKPLAFAGLNRGGIYGPVRNARASNEFSQQDRDAYIYPAFFLSRRAFHSGHDGICASSPYQLSGPRGPTPVQVLKKLVSPVAPSRGGSSISLGKALY
jgi:hypothetical protein